MTFDENDVTGMTHVKPHLQSLSDQKALWDNLDVIDCFATDHAPHTVEDKVKHKCPGFPGLETALPLLLTAVHQGRLTLEDIVVRYHTNPKRIFGLPDQPNTFVEIDMNHEGTFQQSGWTRAKWTPFAGRKYVGAVKRVVLRGKTVFLADKFVKQVMVEATGYGVNVRTLDNDSSPSSNQLKQPNNQIRLYSKKAINANITIPRNILSAEQFSQASLRLIFERTDEIRKDFADGNIEKWKCVLENKSIALFFTEPSTRTRVSFERATKALGGKIIHITGAGSSVQKGETLEDSVSCIQLCGQIDAIVLRQTERGGAHRAAKISEVPIINAGDGSGEHPTQMLLDLYTIRRELGTVGGQCVVIVGDLKYGRTVHSLAKGLSLRENVRLHYVSPANLQMPDDILNYVRECGVEQTIHTKLTNKLVGMADVIYMTRTQKERLSQKERQLSQHFENIITPEVLAKAKRKMIVMHPLPRGDEISTEIDSDPRAAYKRQMANGPFIRMALLTLMFE
ncbi:MAG: hypothetical protein DRI46_10660 [Chloroflexi bacterium]|nr:MAG: hypothetical protein DRI46_10660 [Chloroflexota bacterium]